MMKSWAMAAVAAAAVLGVARGDEPAPEPSPKAVKKFEYAELSILTTTARAAALAAARGGAALPANPAPGGAGPQAGGPGAARGGGRGVGGTTIRRITAARWVTGGGTIEGKNYAELAAKLKLPVANRPLTAQEQRLRLMNYLGQQGWELVPGGEGPAQMTFKREVDR